VNDKENEIRGLKIGVSAGILYEVNGLSARKMIRELNHPTTEQIEKKHGVQQIVKECAKS